MELAVGYFEQGKTDVALDELKQVIAADPTFPDAYNLRGLIYMRLNDIAPGRRQLPPRGGAEPARRQRAAQLRLAAVPAGPLRRSRSARSTRRWPTRSYGDRAKTLMAQGLCQARAGRAAEAERSLARSYELDAGNPITGYNLASLLYQRGELRARAVLHPAPEQQRAGQCRNAVAGHQGRTPHERPAWR